MSNYNTQNKTIKSNKLLFQNEFALPVFEEHRSAPFPLLGDFDYIELYSSNPTLILFEATFNDTVGTCPSCCHDSSLIHEYLYVYPTLTSFNGKVMIAKIKKRSFQCQNNKCDRATFAQDIPAISKHHRISKNCNLYMINQFQEKKSYKQIANSCNVSTTYILHLIDKLQIARINKAEVKNIMVDETRLLNRYSKNTGTYQFFIYDADTRVLIDILADRSKKTVLEYIKTYFPSGSLTTITMDMWKNYADVINEVSSNTHIVIDKFHFVRSIMNSLDQVRLKTIAAVIERYGKNSKQYRELKNKAKVRNLRKRLDKLKDGQYEEILQELSKYPKLYLAYNLKNDFLRAVKGIQSNIGFRLFLKYWLEEVDNMDTTLFDESTTMLKNWEHEIANSFDFEYTNAYVEGTNQKVKLQKKISYGLSNLERTKKRMIIQFGKRDILESSIQEAI